MKEGDTTKQFFLKTGHEEFEKLSSLDILGLVNAGTKEDTSIHKDFLHHLTKTPARYYETRLPWKEDHVPLPANKNLAVARLISTTRKLENTGKLQEYDQIMREQISNGIMGPVPAQPTEEFVHYIPHALSRDSRTHRDNQNEDCLRLFLKSQCPEPLPSRLLGNMTTTTITPI